jgi:hypothetical protein
MPQGSRSVPSSAPDTHPRTTAATTDLARVATFPNSANVGFSTLSVVLDLARWW